MTEQARRRLLLSLDLLYVAIENLLLTIDVADGEGDLTMLVAFARDLEESITSYWQRSDVGLELDELAR